MDQKSISFYFHHNNGFVHNTLSHSLETGAHFLLLGAVRKQYSSVGLNKSFFVDKIISLQTFSQFMIKLNLLLF